MNTIFKNNIIKLVEKNPNEEICGFFYINFDTYNFYQCNNISSGDKKTSFEISTDDFLKAQSMGNIVGIFHSHVGEDSNFSQIDKELSEEIELPIFCYSSFDKVFREYRPSGYKANLYQRPFIYGNYDCFGSVRDYYWNNFNILLDDFDRDNSYDKNNTPIILNQIEKQNFYKPENQIDIKEHDIIVYKSIKHAYPDHLETFIGNSRVYQHLTNRLSGKDLINEGFLKKRYCILRYKDLNLKRNESIC